MRRGKFFVRPVSGPGQRVQVIKAKTEARGLGMPQGRKSGPPASVLKMFIET